MKPAPFDYHAPTTVDEVVALLHEHGDEAKVLAGGQSLIPMLNLRLARFATLVDIGRVASLRRLERVNGHVVVGSMVRQRELEACDVALLAAATPLIGHFQIRNRGTLGGSIAHADPAAEYPAVALALDAELDIAGPAGARTVPAAEFFVGTWETALADDEVLVAVRFPVWGEGSGFSVEEVARRHGDFAIAGCACGVEVGRRPDQSGSHRPVRRRRDAGPSRGRGERTRRCRRRHGRCGGDRQPRRGRVGTSGRPARLGRAAAAHRLGGGDASCWACDRARPPWLTLSVSLTVNGERRAITVEPRKTLADALREDCGLTGTHLGCEHGVCGACTVLLDGDAVRSCLVFAVQADDTEITTVEGLAVDGELNPVQAAFQAEHGLQCGFCTPGFVVSATALLERTPSPSDQEIREGLSGNLCRCTGYQGILRAVHRAAAAMGGTS